MNENPEAGQTCHADKTSKKHEGEKALHKTEEQIYNHDIDSKQEENTMALRADMLQADLRLIASDISEESKIVTLSYRLRKYPLWTKDLKKNATIALASLDYLKLADYFDNGSMAALEELEQEDIDYLQQISPEEAEEI